MDITTNHLILHNKVIRSNGAVFRNNFWFLVRTKTLPYWVVEDGVDGVVGPQLGTLRLWYCGVASGFLGSITSTHWDRSSTSFANSSFDLFVKDLLLKSSGSIFIEFWIFSQNKWNGRICKFQCFMSDIPCILLACNRTSCMDFHNYPKSISIFSPKGLRFHRLNEGFVIFASYQLHKTSLLLCPVIKKKMGIDVNL